MAHNILGQDMSWCFGTSLAPIDMLSFTYVLGWTFSHQRAAQQATVKPLGHRATSQESKHYGVFAHRNPVP